MSPAIKVISLVRSVERRARFSEQNRHVDFTFFDAIDGAKIMPRVNQAPDVFAPGLGYTAGAYGCAMSHLLLWREAAVNGRVLTIIEDDAVLRHDFQQQSAAVLEDLQSDWDIVLWGWNFDSILALNVMPQVSRAVVLFDQARMRRALGEFQSMTGTPSALPLDKCFGSPAYSISPGGARKFIANCFPLKHFTLYFPVLNRELPNTGIDIAMNRIYPLTKSFCCLPPLAVTPNTHAESLVQDASE